MTDLIKDFVAKIDAVISAQFTGKFYGLAETFNAQGQTYPATIATKRDRISPADTWQLQIYHKQLEITRTPELEFGKNKNYAQSMRMIIISNTNLGESLGFRIAQALPLQVIAAPSSSVIDTTEVISNDPAIATTEFGEAWADKYVVTKNIFTIDYTLNITQCP